MPQLTRLALALLLSTLTACGGKSHASPDDGGSGGTNAGGTGNGTSGTGTGGKGHAGAGGADACTVFDDDAPGSIRVAISNLTTAPIYLGQDTVTCGTTPLFQVANADGSPLPGLGDCRSPCVSVRKQGVGGCTGICLLPSAVALQPNEVLYTSWEGLFRVPGQLPAQCVPFDSGGEAMVACDQAKRIEPGSFLFSASAGSALDCSQTTGTGSCSACTASPNGGCSTPGSLVTGATHTTQTFVVLDANYGVFPSASANPGPNAGDAELPAPGDPIVPATVELIFTQ